MKILQKIKFQIIKGQLEKTKKKHPFNETYAEQYKLAPDSPNTINNSYYFSAHNQKGVSLLFRLAIRSDRTELWFVYHDINGKTYINKNLQINDNTKAEVECIEVAKKWKFRFSGEVVELNSDSKNTFQANFEGEFNAGAPIFEFSRHMHPEPVARALSKEKWTKDFRRNLSENHQVHYEQAGKVTVVLNIEAENYNLSLDAVRDHSFGKRDWNYMDRHIWLAMLLETGELLNVSIVRYPAVFELQTGYLEKEGKFISVSEATPMDKISLNGDIPEKFTTVVTLVNNTTLKIECEKETQIKFQMADGLYTIIEGIGKMKVNGVKARGILEFGYNKEEFRWTR